jgi:hydrogenase expression/formation protein HypC
MCLAIPAKIVEFSPGEQTRALVEVAGVRRHIDTGLLVEESLQTGDWVLVHVGFAMSKISEEQALDQIRTLTMLGEQAAVVEEVTGYGLDEPRAARDP